MVYDERIGDNDADAKSEEALPILKSSGKPFRTSRDAMIALQERMDLDRNRCRPVQVEGGWGLVYFPPGQRLPRLAVDPPTWWGTLLRLLFWALVLYASISPFISSSRPQYGDECYQRAGRAVDPCD